MYELVIYTKSIWIDKKYWYCYKKVSRTKVSRKVGKLKKKRMQSKTFFALSAPYFSTLRETFIS